MGQGILVVSMLSLAIWGRGLVFAVALLAISLCAALCGLHGNAAIVLFILQSLSVPITAAIVAGLVFGATFPESRALTGRMMLLAALGAFALHVGTGEAWSWIGDGVVTARAGGVSLEELLRWCSSLIATVSATVCAIMLPVILLELSVGAIVGTGSATGRALAGDLLQAVRLPALIACVAFGVRIAIPEPSESVGENPIIPSEQTARMEVGGSGDGTINQQP